MAPMNMARMAPAMMAAVAMALACAGCSCDESAPEVRQIDVGAKPQQAQQAPQQAAPAAQPESAKPARKPGNSLVNAPADYVRMTTITLPRRIKSQARLAQTMNEIKQFQAIEGHYPKTLKELEEWRGEPLQELPTGYVYSYDPKTGTLDVVLSE